MGERRSVALLTDSTADIPPDLASSEGIEVVPLLVHFGDRTYADGELTPAEFFEKMNAAPELPTTSTPAAGVFEEAYERSLASFDHVVSVHVSSRLSGTIEAARQAAARFGSRVRIVDSRNLSWGLAFQVLAGARAAQAGAAVADVVAAVERCRERVRMVVGLDKLDNLARGGRIGAVSAFLGGMVDLKVLLTVDAEGTFVPVARARGARSAVQRTLDFVAREMQGGRRGAFCVAHSASPDKASTLRALIESIYDVSEMFVVETGAVIMTHTGTGWAVTVVPEDRHGASGSASKGPGNE
jgi:DegV family protein with EDD domain